MLAFLKRRWILLSCAAVLLTASCMEAYVHWPEMKAVRYMYALKDGEFIFRRHGEPQPHGRMPVEFNAPQLGGLPRDESYWVTSDWTLYIPLWLPLAVILGWTVFRELRWREKRAKASDANPPKP